MHPQQPSATISSTTTNGGGGASEAAAACSTSPKGSNDTTSSPSSGKNNQIQQQQQQEQSDREWKSSKRVSFFSSLNSIDESGLLSSISEDTDASPTSIRLLDSAPSQQQQQNKSPNSNDRTVEKTFDKKVKSLPNINTSSSNIHDNNVTSNKSPVQKLVNNAQPSSPISPTVLYYSDYAIKSLPSSRSRGHSVSMNNLHGFNYPLIQIPKMSQNQQQAVTPTTPTPTSVNPYHHTNSSNAIAISHLSFTHNNDGNSSGGSSGGNFSGGFPPTSASYSAGNFSPFNPLATGSYGGVGGGGYNRTRGASMHAGFQPPPLKRAQSVLHSSRVLASSFVRHNVDPKWDMRKDDCFGDDLNELDEESPQLTKRSPLLKQASVFAAASASFSIHEKNSPRLILTNSRDRSLSVDLSSSMFDKVGNVLRERAVVIQQKMNRDLKTFLWELKEIDFESSEISQIEMIAKDILVSKTIDDLCKRDFMKELQAILQTCIYNYTTLTHQSTSPSMHMLSTTPTTPNSLMGTPGIDARAVGKQFEIMKQAKKLIFIYSRVNRVLELYKKHLAEEESREKEKEEIRHRQRFKSLAIVESDSSKERLDYDSSESQDAGRKSPFLLKPTTDDDDTSSSVSPRRSSVSSNSKHEHVGESSDYESPVSSPRSTTSGNGSAPVSIATPRTSKDIPQTPATPTSEKKRFSETFFSKFKTLFSKKEDPSLLSVTTNTTKAKSTNNTPTELKKQPKPKKDVDVIEILCRICEELVPSTKLAEHSATCAVKHKIEMQSLTAFEKLKNIRRGIEKSIKKKKSTALYKLFKLAKKAEKSSDRNQLQEIIGTLSTVIEEHKEDNFSGNNYRVSVYAKRLMDVIEGKCIALLHEEKQSVKRLPRIKISDFEILKPISRGAYGRVYLARKKSTSDIYAIKVIKKQYLYNHKNVGKTLTNEPDLIAERTIMKVLMENNEQSPFIVNFYYSFAGKRYLYIVMEYCPGGSLDCLLADKLENGEGFDIDVVRHIAAESILALSDLHHNKIVHRDLKPDNMLIDKCGHLKLTDFGLSEIGVLDREDEQTSASKQSMDALSRQDELEEPEIQVRGTPDYLAPELLLGMAHTEAVDFWSLGCIVFELLFGCPPFNDDTPEFIFDNILSRRINWVDERLLPPEIVSSGVLSFVDRLLDPNPETRLNERTAKEHPFMQGVDWDKVLKEPVGVLPGVKDMTDTSKFKPREEAFPMHYRESMEAKSLSDIDDSSECLTEQTELGISVSVGRTPPLVSSSSLRDLRAAGRSPPYQRSMSFHSTSTGTPPAGSMTQTDSSLASPSNNNLLLGTSALESFSFPEHVNTSALQRLNEEMIRQSQAVSILSNRSSDTQDNIAASNSSSNNSNTSLAF